MKRTIIRKHVFMILFRAEFHNLSELKEQEQLYLNEVEDITDQEKEYITDRVNKIIKVLPKIDTKIKDISEGWKIERVGKVELAILRLGIFEILFDDDIPTNVALNEAVELSKKFGGDTSHSFINGVLGKLVESKAGLDCTETAEDVEELTDEVATDVVATDEAVTDKVATDETTEAKTKTIEKSEE